MNLIDHPRVSRQRAERARIQLDRALGASKVIADAVACAAYAADDSDVEVPPPDAVVLAASREDIAITLRIANATGVPVTPRAAGTGRSGGAVPVCGGIVLVMTGLDDLKEIDRNDSVAVVGPGIITSTLQQAVEAEGLFFPPDPSSLASCTIGGNVAENAGGPRAFKYGVTRDYTLGLGFTLMGGERLWGGKRTVKGVAGYDLVSLLTGSEGTLAVFDEVTLRLIRRPDRVATMLALFDQVADAGRAVATMRGSDAKPRCIELLDRATLASVRAAGVPLDDRAGALLLVEVDGDEATCEPALETLGNACTSAGAQSVLVAQDGAQRDRLWRARREMSPAIRRLARHKISEDIVVPPSQIVPLLEEIPRISETNRVPMLTYGHAGDGNFHVNFLWNDDAEQPRVQRSIEHLLRYVVSVRGTITGEHGVGVLKAPFLPLEQAPGLIALQHRIKDTFDPQGLLNPGKIFASGVHRYC